MSIVTITGGTGGIGRATAREFAAAGYDVAVLARGAAGLAAVAQEIEAAGVRALAIRTDVTDLDAVVAARDRIEDELGPIDVWVNCAFVGALGWFWDTPPDEYKQITDVTYHGQLHGTRAALEVMRPRDRGSIVNVSSAMAFRAIPLQSAYCGAKHAIKGMTESVITELRAVGSHVHVGMVTLPGVNTTQFQWNLNALQQGRPMPVPPIVQPEVCARAIRFSAEHPRRNAWVGVATAYTVLGNRVAPAFVDWYLARNGVKSQQTSREFARFGPNVWEPADEETDRGSHGPFDDKAHAHDPMSFAGQHRRALLGAMAAVTAASVGWLVRQ